MDIELPSDSHLEQQKQRYKAMPNNKRRKYYTLSHLLGTERLEALETIRQWVQENGRIWSRKILYTLTPHFVPDTSDKEYEKIIKLAKSWRFYGMMDYADFKDRRTTIHSVGIKDGSSFNTRFKRLCKYYSRSSRSLQDNYVEVWTEEQLPDTTRRILRDWEVGLVMGEGFIGDVPLHNAANRIKEIRRDYDKPVIILYISDYDPEGEHTFSIAKNELEDKDDDVTVDKVFLTKPQILEYHLSSNVGYAERMDTPTNRRNHWKKKYVKQFVEDNKDLGNEGWVQYELDQMPVKILNKELEGRISRYMDMDLKENIDKECRKETKEWLHRHYNGNPDEILQ